MRLHRFFVTPVAREGQTVRLEGAQARQIARVLRLTPGEHIITLDGSGVEWVTALVRVTPALVEGAIVAERRCPGEPRLRLTLVQALLKGDHFEWVLQKGTETGIAAFVPVVTRRTVVPLAAAAGKRGRWEAIVREAAEQSGRGLLPPIAPACPLVDALRAAPHPLIVLWEEERGAGLRAVLAQLGPITAATLVVGPEGGLTAEEAEAARAVGAITVGLGPRILRAETAGVIAAAAILYHYGDLGG